MQLQNISSPAKLIFFGHPPKDVLGWPIWVIPKQAANEHSLGIRYFISSQDVLG